MSMIHWLHGMKSGAITGSSYSFSLTNGSYSYNIATNNKIYHADGGSFRVNVTDAETDAPFTLNDPED